MKPLYCPVQFQAKIIPDRIAISTEEHDYRYSDLEQLIGRACFFLDSTIKSKGCSLYILKASLNLNTIVVYLASLRLSLTPCLIHPKESQEKILTIQQDLKTSFIIDPLEINLGQNSLNIQRFFFPRNLTTFLMTSGTSGKPKYAGLSLHNFYYNYKGIKRILRLSKTSRYLLNLPLNHVSGLSIIFRTFFSGAILVLKTPTSTFSSFILEEKISHLSLVALQLRRWINEKSFSTYPDLKSVLLGGGPTPDSIITEALKKDIPLFHSYGMTEASSTITCKKLKLDEDYRCGKPLLYQVVKILKNKEICISGKTLFLGYLDTKQMKLRPKWQLKTKDVGIFNKQKDLLLLGRKDNMVINRGENIYPEEIEKALTTHKNIQKACVVAITTEETSELVAYLETDTKKIPENLSNFLKDKLPSYKHPSRFFLWPSNLDLESSKNPKYLRKIFYNLALSNKLTSS